MAFKVSNMNDETPFRDKNGRVIRVGDVVKRTAEFRTGILVSNGGRGKKRETFARYSTMEVLCTVKFGLFKRYIGEEIITYYLETDATTSYDSYFWCFSNKDLPDKAVENLSDMLSTKTATQCEVVDPKV